MKWIKQFLDATEAKLTRTVAQAKIKGLFKKLKAREDDEAKSLDTMQNQVEDSTEILGEIVDGIFGQWAIGYKAISKVLTDSLIGNEEKIVNFVTNNADAIMMLGTAVKKLDTNVNRQTIVSIGTEIYDDGKDYVQTTFKKQLEDFQTASLNRDMQDLGKIWGKEMKYYILELIDGTTDVDTVEVTEEAYKLYKKNYMAKHGKFDEESTLFTTRQTSLIHPKEA